MSPFEIASDVFTVTNIAIMSGGLIFGMVAGALPGISSTMAVTLLLPFTFALPAGSGLMLLMAIYTASVYGGSISAILINTPGTGSSAATAIDGYQLTRKGHGARALRISTFASALGGVVSAIALILLSPPLSKISLWFGPPEYFLLACLGLSAVATLAANSIAKGILAAVIGLFLASVGLDYSLGSPRFTFGIMELEGGISFIPALIGLFALSEVLRMAENRFAPDSKPADFRNDRFFPSLAELAPTWATMGRGSVIGTIIGILPGAGAEIGSWISYNTEKRLSKHRHEIGHGSTVGVAASEVANNAVTGAALIPLFTLGIPGSSVAAVILGGLLIHGLVPGRELFTEYATITYTAMFGFLIANILMLFFGLLLVKPFAQVTKIPRRYLAPIIVTLCFIGAYAINNSFFDVGIMVVFGVIGYVLQRAGFHPAPIVLAMILGPMAESRYLQMYSLSDGNVISYMFTRPISLALIGMIVLFLFSPAFFKNVQQGPAPETAPGSVKDTQEAA
ncbi:Integral membrane protein [uncultured delta proteobacterium]|uniref:Integral membrane protein n=1 Tax=uncultured delta proteobacterium TaxID=34034 RepID=A0A212JAG1_9DELT|nr:Integral membrane protein [uncultured delta proteobacterium]